jgi:hypothetical protein
MFPFTRAAGEKTETDLAQRVKQLELALRQEQEARRGADARANASEKEVDRLQGECSKLLDANVRLQVENGKQPPKAEIVRAQVARVEAATRTFGEETFGKTPEAHVLALVRDTQKHGLVPTLAERNFIALSGATRNVKARRLACKELTAAAHDALFAFRSFPAILKPVCEVIRILGEDDKCRDTVLASRSRADRAQPTIPQALRQLFVNQEEFGLAENKPCVASVLWAMSTLEESIEAVRVMKHIDPRVDSADLVAAGLSVIRAPTFVKEEIAFDLETELERATLEVLREEEEKEEQAVGAQHEVMVRPDLDSFR